MLTQSRQRTNDRLGFTLMEVLLVMAILVILGSIVVAGFTDILETSKEDATQTQLQMFELPLNAYKMHVGNFPTADVGLEALRVDPTDTEGKWRGPYLQKEIPVDQWGNAFIYERVMNPMNNRSAYKIRSSGADGSDGTPDDIEIVSYE